MVNEPRPIMDAFALFVSTLVSSTPVLAVIEDLHWSDDASLDALLALVRRSAHQPFLLLLSYRHDELSPGLSQLLVELDRGHTATELVLQPLTPDEIDGMLRAMFNQVEPVRSQFRDAIAALTEGNPFFIEEVIKSLIASGGSRGRRDQANCTEWFSANHACRWPIPVVANTRPGRLAARRQESGRHRRSGLLPAS